MIHTPQKHTLERERRSTQPPSGFSPRCPFAFVAPALACLAMFALLVAPGLFFGSFAAAQDEAPPQTQNQTQDQTQTPAPAPIPAPARDAARQLTAKPKPSGASAEGYSAIPTAGRRAALVVGAANYQAVAPLNNPLNDATAIHAFLQTSGFDAALVTDPTLRQFNDAIDAFAGKIQEADAALFYFSGHGLQVKGDNYLVPIDATIPSEADVAYQCVHAGRLMAKMDESRCRVNIVILDACRNNPFVRSFRTTGQQRGLAFMEAARGTLVAFSTSPGKTADDAVAGGAHSPYTAALIKHFPRPGVPLQDLFLDVRKDVLASTRGEQVPWEVTSLTDKFYFQLSGATPVPPPPPASTPSTAYTPAPHLRKSNLEARNAFDELKAAFDKKKLSLKDKLAYLDDFTRDWPGTTAGDEAAAMIASIRRLEKLQAEAQKEFARLMERDARPPLTQADASRRAADWAAYLQKYADADYRLSEARAQCQRYTDWKPGPQPGDDMTLDLGGGVQLELVWIPGGTFQMGSHQTPEEIVGLYGGEAKFYEDERPVHTVTVDGFWMGKYEVTNAQYRRYQSSHSSKDFSGFSLNGDDQPVVYVSWDDAKGFCKWLSDRAGKTIRLPTEAEWEYAARAGTTTARYWGDDDASMGRYANVADRTAKSQWSEWTIAETTDGYKVAAPVGSFQPNAFGLYDMIGNVWEWCEDWYGNYSSSSQRNPTGPPSGTFRVLRGGSWYDNPRNCRSSNRDRGVPGHSLNNRGFRVVWVSAGSN